MCVLVCVYMHVCIKHLAALRSSKCSKNTNCYCYNHPFVQSSEETRAQVPGDVEVWPPTTWPCCIQAVPSRELHAGVGVDMPHKEPWGLSSCSQHPEAHQKIPVPRQQSVSTAKVRHQ